MVIRRSRFGVVVAALLLSGCSWFSNTADSVWGSLSGEDTSSSGFPAPAPDESGAAAGGTGTVVAIPPSGAEANTQPTFTRQPPAPGTANYAAQPVAPGSPTGTYVGAKIVAMRGDLQRLQDNINQQNASYQQIRQAIGQDASSYFGLIGNINSRLQVGTTPGNPDLINQWNQAQGALDRMSSGIARFNSLSTQVAGDSSVAAYLLDSVRAAYSLQGAVDEDHRQLNVLQADVSRTVPQIDQLLSALSEDIGRQSTYVGNERQNLVALSQAIKNGELYGRGINTRSIGAAPKRASSAAVNRPLVTIRFDRPNVNYEQALYSAVSSALARRPSATFDLVAVAPRAGSPEEMAVHTDAAKRNAQSVMRSMTNMGLAADRMSLSATTSGSVRSNEVQIYVR